MAKEEEAAYLVSESLHWATAPPVGQGLNSMGKDGFELARPGWEMFLLFWLSFCLVIAPWFPCSFYFLCVSLFTSCTLGRKFWLSDWLIQNPVIYEWYFMCLGLNSWCKFFWSWKGHICLILYVFIICCLFACLFVSFTYCFGIWYFIDIFNIFLNIYHGPRLPSYLADLMSAWMTPCCTMTWEI